MSITWQLWTIRSALICHGTAVAVRYRFLFLNKGEWNALQTVSKVNFSELAPGRHTVSVKAGRTSAITGMRCDDSNPPHWYATTPNHLLGLLAWLRRPDHILTRSFYRLHIQQLQQAQQEEINEAAAVF